MFDKDERIKKLERAHVKVEEALKAVEETGCSVFGDTLRNMLVGIGAELNSAKAWAIESSRPYYGG